MAVVAEPIVRPRRLTFNPSTSSDVRDHFLVHMVGDGLLTHDSVPVSVGDYLEGDQIVVPLNELFNFEDGAVVSFAAYAEDNSGNKSALWQHPSWVAVPLDFTPPLPPSGGSLD